MRRELTTRVGVGYRHALSRWISARPRGVSCLEITAEHFFEDASPLKELRRSFPLFVHGLGLSLGTPGKLDPEVLKRFAQVAEVAQPEWVSEHIAFTRTSEVDLGHLNPIQPNKRALEILAAHAREVSDRCRRPIILENITSHLKLEGELSETEFLNQLCEKADCGLLLDVTNLFINSRNHGFDATKWLREIQPQRIVQLHIVGYSKRGERYIDDHAAAVQPELIELLKEVIAYAPVKAVILERDEALEDANAIEAEVEKLEAACGAD